MTTRPGYIWSGTEWVAIGQEAVVAPVSYQTSAPSTPATGDIWIDSDDDVPGIDTSQFLRWRKTMAGGETSLSGTDDNGLTLKYTPNYEQLYINGVLQVRSQDYTATNGTSITGLTALAANDVVEVFGVVARTVGDVYTQAQADGKYSPITTTGLVLLNPLTANNTFTAVTSFSIDNVFTSSYENYHLVVTFDKSVTTGAPTFVFRTSGTDNTTSNYYSASYFMQIDGATTGTNKYSATTSFGLSDGAGIYSSYWVFKPQLSNKTFFSSTKNGFTYSTQFFTGDTSGLFNATTVFDGFKISVPSGTMTGTIKVYGYK
jgi:hypothetical protein